MAKLNRTCGICRKKYSYCPSCAVDANKPTWMAIFCCDNCRDIYNAINDYEYKLLSKEEAFDKLSKLDLSCKNELPKDFRKTLDEIMEEIVEKSVCIEKQSENEELVEEKIVNEKAIEKQESVKVKKRNTNKKTDSTNNIIDNE